MWLRLAGTTGGHPGPLPAQAGSLEPTTQHEGRPCPGGSLWVGAAGQLWPLLCQVSVAGGFPHRATSEKQWLSADVWVFPIWLFFHTHLACILALGEIQLDVSLVLPDEPFFTRAVGLEGD